MLHTLILGHRSRNLDLPASIQKLSINPAQFLDFYKTNQDAKISGMPIIIDHDLNKLSSPGIELHAVGTDRASRKPLTQKPPIYNQSVFIPYKDEDCNNNVIGSLTVDGVGTEDQYNSVSTQFATYLFDIILDNSSKFSIACVECVETEEEAVVGHLKEVDGFRVEYKLTRTVYLPECSEEWLNERTLEGTTVLEGGAQEFDKMEEQKDVVIVHDMKLLETAKEMVPNYGFITVVTDENVNSEYQNLELISHKPFAGKEAFLFRKVVTKPEDRYYQIIHVHTKSFEWFKQLKEAMNTSANMEAEGAMAEKEEFRILLLSLNDTQSGIVGLVKCLRKEPGGSAIRYIFSQDTSMDTNQFEIETGMNLKYLSDPFKRILTQDLVHNVIDKDGRLGFHSHQQFFPLASVPARHCIVDQQVAGDAQSFGWVEAPTSGCRQTSVVSSPDEHTCTKQIDVHYAVVHLGELQAVSNALGNANLYNGPLHANHPFAIEYSGVDKCGKQFIGISNASGLGSTVCVDEESSFLVELPDDVSLAAGATLPLAYLTTIYTLLIRGRLTSKDTILVHDGSSPVGQAAIHIANYINATVYTTVETKEQKQFLSRTLEHLPTNNIMYTTDNSFESSLLKSTNGKGVNVVLNTLTSEAGLEASTRTLANGGRFIDIARRSKVSGVSSTAMAAIFSKNVTYHNILPDALMSKENHDRADVIAKFEELLHKKALHPINSTVFSRNELSVALRSISNQKRMGKIVLKLKDDAAPAPTVLPRTYFNPDKVYILAGGLGDTGLEMVSWMITRGCKKLILCNRSGITNSYQQYHVRNWIESGIDVKTPKIDITSMKDLESLKDLIRGRPVGGIFNLSMVLRDSFIASMSYEDFLTAVRPKILGTRNLDQLARKYCGPELEYFVVFSSITSARGNEGQCNYGFGNSVTERLIEERIADGLPGMAIQFGPIGDVGYVEYGMGGSSDDKIIAGTHPQRIRSVISSLDKLLKEPTGIKCSAVIAQKKTSNSGSGRLTLLESIASVLGLNEANKVDQAAKLGELGMDSLMAVEMRQMIERDFGLFHSIQELRTLTVGELVSKSEKKK